MIGPSEAATQLAPPPEPESAIPRAKPHLTPEEKQLVVALMREFPNLDQLMAETIVLANPAYDEVIAMENRAIKKMKAEMREPEKENVLSSVSISEA